MPTSMVRGRFVWHELTTTETKSAADFFAKIVGWKTQKWDQNPSYLMFVAGGRPMPALWCYLMRWKRGARRLIG